MNENNIDMNKLLTMLSKMNKKQLESGLKQVQNMLNSQDKKWIQEFLSGGNRKKILIIPIFI